MRTLNDIPDYLREPEQAPLTFWQGLRRGAIFTLLVSCVIAIGMGGVGYLVPVLVCHLVLNFAWGFFITFTLFGVMHKSARMVDRWCAAVVVVCATLPLMASYVCTVMHLAAASEQSFATVWPANAAVGAVGSNLPALFGTIVAAALCKDGEFSLLDLADILMINPLTGRRG